MVWKLKEREMQEKFERRVEELVDVETTNLWESKEMEFWRHVMSYVGRRKSERVEEINGGGMKKWGML